LSGSVGPARISSISIPRRAQPADRGGRVEDALLFSMRATSATLTGDASGCGSGVKWAMSTPEPRISAIRAGSIPSPTRAEQSSGFCAMTRPSPRAQRNARRSGSRDSPAMPPPSPITAATNAGRLLPRNATRKAAAPNRIGFSATWWMMSGRSAR